MTFGFAVTGGSTMPSNMYYLNIFICISASAFACYFLLKVLIPLLRFRLIDVPNARSSHSNPTPRGGGLVFVLIVNLAIAFSFFFFPNSTNAVCWIPLLAFPLAVVGFLDDLYNLSSFLRYVVQLASAVFLVLASHLNFTWLMLPILLISLTSVINFINFMDGMDGLVAGCMCVAIAVTAFHLTASLPLWTLVGGLLGFCFLNWSPAKVFMGDVGSTFLGAVFIGLVLQSPNWFEAFGLLLVATPLLSDACFCALRRLIDGQRVFQAHRLHLFQRLHQVGWAHADVSILYIAATFVLSAALLLGGLTWVITFAALELLIGIWLDQRVAVPFAVACRN